MVPRHQSRMRRSPWRGTTDRTLLLASILSSRKFLSTRKRPTRRWKSSLQKLLASERGPGIDRGPEQGSRDFVRLFISLKISDPCSGPLAPAPPQPAADALVVRALVASRLPRLAAWSLPAVIPPR
jgi:hypothetical protein